MKPIAAILSVCLVLVACAPSNPQDTIPKTDVELLHAALLNGNFTSENITVAGVAVGMTEADVVARLGTADKTDTYDFGGVQNWQYGQRLGLSEIGLLIHFENGVVTRIVVTDATDSILPEANKVALTKEQAYARFGIPDRQYDFPLRQQNGTYYGGRFFVYNKQGFELYLNKDGVYQYAFVYPNRKLPSMAYFNQSKNQTDILKPTLPVLMTDTTTLCDQGPTFGADVPTGACQAFATSCEIPDNWVEVPDCGNKTA